MCTDVYKNNFKNVHSQKTKSHEVNYLLIYFEVKKMNRKENKELCFFTSFISVLKTNLRNSQKHLMNMLVNPTDVNHMDRAMFHMVQLDIRLSTFDRMLIPKIKINK